MYRHQSKCKHPAFMPGNVRGLVILNSSTGREEHLELVRAPADVVPRAAESFPRDLRIVRVRRRSRLWSPPRLRGWTGTSWRSTLPVGEGSRGWWTRICSRPFGLRCPCRLSHARYTPLDSLSCQQLLWSAPSNEAARGGANGSRGSSCKRTVKPQNSLTPVYTRFRDACSCTAWRSRDPGSRPGKSPKQARRLAQFLRPAGRPRARHLATRLRDDSARHGQVKEHGRCDWQRRAPLPVHRAGPCSRRMLAATSNLRSTFSAVQHWTLPCTDTAFWDTTASKPSRLMRRSTPAEKRRCPATAPGSSRP